MGKKVRTATMRMLIRMRMRWTKHRQPMMDQRRMWMTNLGTSGVNGDECEDGDDTDTDAEKAALQADDGSIQNMVN
jgi:hypothetical protein